MDPKRYVTLVLVESWECLPTHYTHQSGYTASNRALRGTEYHAETLESALYSCATAYLQACGLQATPESVWSHTRADSRRTNCHSYHVQITGVTEVTE